MRLYNYISENTFKQDEFYDVKMKNVSAFLKDCVSKAYKVNVDELDCNVSMRRVKSKVSAKEVIKMAEKNDYSYYTFIVRNFTLMNKKPYIEAGVITNKKFEKEYFIFAFIKLEKLDYFINKYNLKRRGS